MRGAVETAARVVKGLDHFLSTLALIIPGTLPAVDSVPLGRDLSEEVPLFRNLLGTLRQVAKRGGGGLVMEEVLRRHLAGVGSPPPPSRLPPLPP